jgi:hypothetical protein
MIADATNRAPRKRPLKAIAAGDGLALPALSSRLSAAFFEDLLLE